jgi:hypothetical protein
MRTNAHRRKNLPAAELTRELAARLSTGEGASGIRARLVWYKGRLETHEVPRDRHTL